MASEASSRSTKQVQTIHKETTTTHDVCTGGEDRISNLPNAILGDILSLLSSTKDAVGTSVLSKRWRYAWSSVPCINITDFLLLSKGNRSSSHEVKSCFIDFVDRVLLLNQVSCLKSFQLYCTEDYGLSRISEWIHTVAIRDVEELDIKYQFWQCLKLPTCIFTSKKLVILTLEKQLFLDVPMSACLPSLKVLQLVKVQYLDDNSLKNLLAGCPVLEQLDVEQAYNDNTKTLHIQSSSLKSLRLETARFCEEDLEIVIDAKILQRVILVDYVTKQFDVISLPSVVSLNLDTHEENTTVVEILRKTCNTKYLNLSFTTMKSLKWAPLDDLPMFHFLTHLAVEFIGSSLRVVPYLLECSPNLRTFELSHGLNLFTIDWDHVDVVEFCAPKCLMLHLEIINIYGFKWCSYEMEMVSFFLKNAMVLKKMYIDPGNLRPEESNLCKELCMLPKFSPACELEIFSYNCSVKKDFPICQSYLDSNVWCSSTS